MVMDTKRCPWRQGYRWGREGPGPSGSCKVWPENAGAHSGHALFNPLHPTNHRIPTTPAGELFTSGRVLGCPHLVEFHGLPLLVALRISIK